MLLSRIYIVGNNETYLCLRVKCPIGLADFNQIWNFSTDFQYKTPIYKVTDIFPVGDTLIIADRQTDLTKLTGSFADCANAPKNH
jgi:hypothetical protein